MKELKSLIADMELDLARRSDEIVKLEKWIAAAKAICGGKRWKDLNNLDLKVGDLCLY